MQLVHVSNLMQSLSHICTYQKENWESCCSHFNQSWGALCHYRRHLLLALTPLVIHPLYKEFIWCNYVVPSMGKIIYCIGEKWYLRLAKNTAKNAQTCHSEALLFPPLWFSWPIRNTLGVDSLRFCPVLCLWPVLCTVVLPSYHNVPLIP